MKVTFHYGDYSIVVNDNETLSVIYNCKVFQHTFKNTIDEVLDTEMMIDNDYSVTIADEVLVWIKTVYNNYQFCFNS